MANRLGKALKSIAGSRYLQRLLLSYLILFAFLFTSGTVMYSNLLSKLRAENDAKFDSLFTSACRLLDERITEAIEISDAICANSALNNFLITSSLNSSELISNLNTISVWLTDYTQTGSLIADYYIYDFTHNVMLCPGGSTFRLEQQYEKLFKYGSYSYAEWRTGILNERAYHRFMPEDAGSVNNSAGKYMLLITSIYPKRGTAHIGQLVMRLDPGMLSAMINSYEGSFEEFRITDGSGLVLFASGGIGGANGSVYTADSSVKGLTYSAVRGLNTDETQVIRARTLTNAAVIISAVTGFALSCVLAYRNSKQVIHIHASINAGESTPAPRTRFSRKDTELNAIDRGIARLIDNSREMEKRLARQNMLLRESMSARLVYSYLSDTDEIEAALGGENIRLRGGSYRGIFALVNADESENRGAALQEARCEIERHTDYVSFCVPVDRSKLAVLAYSEGDNDFDDQLSELLVSIHDYLAEAGINIRFCIGKHVAGIGEIRASFIDAEHIVNEYEYTGTNEVLFRGKNGGVRRLMCGEELTGVREYAMAGNAGALEKLLDGIYADLFSLQPVEQFRVKAMVYALSAALSEVCAQLEIQSGDILDGLDRIPELSHGTKSFDELRNRYTLLCALTGERKKQRGNELCEQVKQWVKEHYAESELTVTDIADRFGLNERYLMGLFKDCEGVTLWNYVIDLRVNEAARLLADPNISVSEVAGRVGYLNVSSFRRMYKQHTGGELPSDKRKS